MIQDINIFFFLLREEKNFINILTIQAFKSFVDISLPFSFTVLRKDQQASLESLVPLCSPWPHPGWHSVLILETLLKFIQLSLPIFGRVRITGAIPYSTVLLQFMKFDAFN